GHAGPRPRAGAPGPPSRPPRPSAPSPPPHHSRPAARPRSSPANRHLTSGDTGYKLSSSSRTAPAGPATGTPPGPGGTLRRSPPGGHSTGALPRMIRQQRLQQRPLRITEIRSIQPAIIHSEIQAETTLKIYGTRPTGHALARTRLEHTSAAVALNLIRLHAFWNGHPLAGPAQATSPASNSPTPHEHESTSRVLRDHKTRSTCSNSPLIKIARKLGWG